MKIRTDFVTNSSSSSFVLEISIALKNGRYYAFSGRGSCGEGPRMDFHELNMSVSPRQLGTAQSIDALVDMLKNGVTDGNSWGNDGINDRIFDENNSRLEWARSNGHPSASSYEDALGFIDWVSGISDIDDIAKITVTGNEYNYKNYLRTYEYDRTTDTYTKKIFGGFITKDGGSGGDLRFSDDGLAIDPRTLVEFKFTENVEFLDFEGKRFVLTGFSASQKQKLGQEITSRGGSVIGSVSSLTYCLIVNENYGMSTSKYEKACDLRKSGSSIIIISGRTFKDLISKQQAAGKAIMAAAKTRAEISDKDWEVSRLPDGTLYIEGYSGENENIVIPEKLGDIPVTRIGNKAFFVDPKQKERAARLKKIKSIVIPEGVTSIGDAAFKGCAGLTSISIPAGVKSVGDDAFMNCRKLRSITIPDGVTSIGKQVFKNCSGLTSIELPRGIKFIGESAFESCEKLQSLTIPYGVTTVGNWGLSSCKALTSITIPDSVISIGDYAFEECRGLTSITIPDSVTSIGAWAFCSCEGLTSITIPDSVTSIGVFAFNDCTSLTSIKIPDGMTSIGGSPFCGCTGLTSITIPDGMTSIGGFAFDECTGLTSITIPDSVTSIGNGAFSGCCRLTSVTIPDSVTSIGWDVFERCVKITIVCSAGSCAEKYAKENNIPFTTTG